MTGKRGYSPERDIRAAMLGAGEDSPTAIVKWLLDKKGIVKSDTSVTMWLRRNPDEAAAMRVELAAQKLDIATMSAKIFTKGTFESYPKIREWVKVMTLGKVQNITGNVNKFKALCQGVRRGISPITQASYYTGQRKAERELGHRGKGIDLAKDHGWVMKHPERITVEDVQDYVFMMLENYPDVDNAGARLAARGFFSANGVPVGSRIAGTKHKSAEKYAKLYVERDVLEKILQYLRVHDFEAYVIDLFMFKTGTRIGATLDAVLNNLKNYGTENWSLVVYDKAVRSKYPEGKEWDKFISPDVYEAIALLTDHPRRVAGKIFTKTSEEMADINGEMLDKFFPQLRIGTKEADFKDVMFPGFENTNHFWRHMFAQHMLRATKWNYGIVASLGGWDVKSLEESYGMPTLEVVREWGSNVVYKL